MGDSTDDASLEEIKGNFDRELSKLKLASAYLEEAKRVVTQNWVTDDPQNSEKAAQRCTQEAQKHLTYAQLNKEAVRILQGGSSGALTDSTSFQATTHGDKHDDIVTWFTKHAQALRQNATDIRAAHCDMRDQPYISQIGDCFRDLDRKFQEIDSDSSIPMKDKDSVKDFCANIANNKSANLFKSFTDFCQKSKSDYEAKVAQLAACMDHTGTAEPVKPTTTPAHASDAVPQSQATPQHTGTPYTDHHTDDVDHSQWSNSTTFDAAGLSNAGSGWGQVATGGVSSAGQIVGQATQAAGSLATPFTQLASGIPNQISGLATGVVSQSVGHDFGSTDFTQSDQTSTGEHTGIGTHVDNSTANDTNTTNSNTTDSSGSSFGSSSVGSDHRETVASNATRFEVGSGPARTSARGYGDIGDADPTKFFNELHY